jgi:hypothetical protein
MLEWKPCLKGKSTDKRLRCVRSGFYKVNLSIKDRRDGGGDALEDEIRQHKHEEVN